MKELPYPPNLPQAAFPSRLKYVGTAKAFYAPFPFTAPIVVLTLFLVWTTVALPFDTEWGGAPVWVWGLFLVITLFNYFLLVWLCNVLFGFIAVKNYELTKLYYFTYQTATPLGMALASIVQMAINLVFLLGPAESIVIENVYSVSGVVLCFAVAFALTGCCTKISIR